MNAVIYWGITVIVIGTDIKVVIIILHLIQQELLETKDINTLL